MIHERSLNLRLVDVITNFEKVRKFVFSCHNHNFDTYTDTIRISQHFLCCQKLWYIARLSKKYFLGIFANFAYNNIRYLEAIKTLFWGFSTVSAVTCNWVLIQLIHLTESYFLAPESFRI